MNLRLVAALVALGLATAPSKAQTAAPARVAYELRMTNPQAHVFDVTMRIGTVDSDSVTVAMPIWMPGYYSADHYAKNVTRFSATGDDGIALPWKQDGDTKWVIAAKAHGSVTVHYDVFADRPSAIGTQLSSAGAEWEGAELFMFVLGADGYPVAGPVTLHVARPQGWELQSGLIALQSAPDTFTAPSYDVLVDCPALVAPHMQMRQFVADGATYHVVTDGPGTYSIDDLATVAKKVVTTESHIMGGPGYAQYWILLLVNGGGGVEHLNSVLMNLRQYGWERKATWPYPAAGTEGPLAPLYVFAKLIAHEHFHSWNVKRIRPKVLGPFDYLHEVHTRRLDVAEGFNEYYTEVSLLRAGIIDQAAFLRYLAADIQTEQTSPGRKWFSLGDLSWNVWWPTDDDNVPVDDYYDGGVAMAFMLDLQIRHDTDEKRSLDDVMHALYADWKAKRTDEFTSTGGTYGDGDWPGLIARVTGDGTAGNAFAADFDSTTLPDWNAVLAFAGLELSKEPQRSTAPTLGLQPLQIGAPDGVGYVSRIERASYGFPNALPDEYMVDRVDANGPAERAGIERFDVLTAFDGMQLTSRSLPGLLAEHAPGDRIEITFARKGAMLTVPLELGPPEPPNDTIVPRSSPAPGEEHLWSAFSARV